MLEEAARKRYADGAASRVAIIAKGKADGPAKRRIILDMRRSGNNSHVVIPERIVLPRVQDVIMGVA
eukprot:15431812-Alexandrium_andersonii.AAC.1